MSLLRCAQLPAECLSHGFSSCHSPTGGGLRRGASRHEPCFLIRAVWNSAPASRATKSCPPLAQLLLPHGAASLLPQEAFPHGLLLYEALWLHLSVLCLVSDFLGHGTPPGISAVLPPQSGTPCGQGWVSSPLCFWYSGNKVDPDLKSLGS